MMDDQDQNDQILCVITDLNTPWNEWLFENAVCSALNTCTNLIGWNTFERCKLLTYNHRKDMTFTVKFHDLRSMSEYGNK